MHSAPTRPIPSAARRKNRISLDSDEESEVEEPIESQIPKETTRRRSLTPPPELDEAKIQHALSLLNDRPHEPSGRVTRQSANSTVEDTMTKPNEFSDDEDDFDIEKYKDKMNSEMDRQAAQFLQESEKPPEKILLLMVGHKKKGDEIPAGWEKPMGLRVMTTVTFDKIQDEFKKNKTYTGNVVLAFKGVRLLQGTPEKFGMTEKDRLGK